MGFRAHQGMQPSYGAMPLGVPSGIARRDRNETEASRASREEQPVPQSTANPHHKLTENPDFRGLDSSGVLPARG